MALLEFRMRMDNQNFLRELSGLAEGLSRWATGKINGASAAFAAIQRHHKNVYDSGASGFANGPWERLRVSTLRSRRLGVRCSRIAPRDYAGPRAGGGILFWSGRLRSSLTGEDLVGSNYRDRVRQVRARGLTYGTATPTAAILWAGRGGRNPMPVRKPIDDIGGPEVGIDAIEAKILAFLTGTSYDWSSPS